MGFKGSRVRIPPSRPLNLKDLEAAGNGGFFYDGHALGHIWRRRGFGGRVRTCSSPAAFEWPVGTLGLLGERGVVSDAPSFPRDESGAYAEGDGAAKARRRGKICPNDRPAVGCHEEATRATAGLSSSSDGREFSPVSEESGD
jgi:hypothetical protein